MWINPAPGKTFEEEKAGSPAIQSLKLQAVITTEQPKEEIKEVAVATVVPTAKTTMMKIKEDLQENRPTRNLDSTLKLVLDLNRRINQKR